MLETADLACIQTLHLAGEYPYLVASHRAISPWCNHGAIPRAHLQGIYLPPGNPVRFYICKSS